MATTTLELKRLQREVATLKKKVARLERRGNGEARAEMPKARTMSENERADEILRRAGLLSEPTEKEKQLVQEWERVPLSERQRLVQVLRNVKLDKPLSEMITENRR